MTEYARICPNIGSRICRVFPRIRDVSAYGLGHVSHGGDCYAIDDLQKRYSELILMTLRPHYDLVTLMDHIGSSLDRLEVDQRGRNFPPRAPRRLAATPNRNVSCLHTSIAPLPFVIGHF